MASKAARATLLTGNALRHSYAEKVIASQLELVGVVTEEKRPVYKLTEGISQQDQQLLEQHLAERNSAERRYLGKQESSVTEHLSVATGQINNQSVFEWVKEKDPDILLLYGTSIVRAPLLERFAERTINVHLGLSPYYRGAGTNFWPLVDGLPECVGATIHLATLTVDGGPILGQVRPEPLETDGAHDLGTKTIIRAMSVLPRLAISYLEGTIQPVQQDLGAGKEFRRKDFTADAIRRMRKNFAGGMMPIYCAELEGRQDRFPIVEIPD